MIILASQSPRRCELMKFSGFDFAVKPSEADENIEKKLSPKETVEILSLRKAMAIKSKDDIIIGADTVVAIDGEILGKPKNENDAYNMLKKLSGRTHSVFTGVTVIKNEKIKTFCEETRVTFYHISDEEIKAYIKTGEPMDKAGAYGIQEKGGLFVEKTEGDYNNVVGLPMSKLVRVLKEFM